MANGLYHDNEAIATLERERDSWSEALGMFTEEQKKEYSEAYKLRKLKVKQLEDAIKILEEHAK